MTAAEEKHVARLVREIKRLEKQERKLREEDAPDEVLFVFEAAKAERVELIRMRLGVAHA